MLRTVLLIILLIMQPITAQAAGAPGSPDQIKPATGPLFGQSRLRAFVLDNFDRFARLKQPLPALSQDALRFGSQSYRPDDVTFILESFSGLFPGTYDDTTNNVIEIYDADDLSVQIAEKIRPLDTKTSDLILKGIQDGSLCWSGKLPTPDRNIPVILVSQKASKAALSECLYRSVMAQMGVLVLYKDRFPAEGRLDAILSHMANVTAMHIYFECRQHIREQDFTKARRCVGDQFDARY